MMKKNSKFKIVFMGGNLIGCSVLRYLLRLKEAKISLVVGCYNDNGSVIEPKAWNASLARVALSKGLPFVQPKSPRNLQFINDIQRIDKPDLILMAGYDQILDPIMLDVPTAGTLNIHFSSLPKHRGHFPIVWSILNDQKAGVSMHWVNDKINGGDIIAQQAIAIDDEDTAFSLYEKLTKIGVKLVKKHFPQILKEKAPRLPQQDDFSSYHAAGYPYQRFIDWNKSSNQIDRLIRALTFPGFESARTFLGAMEICILNPVERLPDSERGNYEPGTILDILPKGIIVQTGKDRLLIKKIKINKSIPIDTYKLCKLFSLNIGDTFKSYENLSSEGKLNLIVP